MRRNPLLSASAAKGTEPPEVLKMLNRLFSAWDSLLDENSVFKVETIGDAYMVASGMPWQATNVDATCDIAEMAVDMIQSIEDFRTPQALISLSLPLARATRDSAGLCIRTPCIGTGCLPLCAVALQARNAR